MGVGMWPKRDLPLRAPASFTEMKFGVNLTNFPKKELVLVKNSSSSVSDGDTIFPMCVVQYQVRISNPSMVRCMQAGYSCKERTRVLGQWMQP